MCLLPASLCPIVLVRCKAFPPPCLNFLHLLSSITEQSQWQMSLEQGKEVKVNRISDVHSNPSRFRNWSPLSVPVGVGPALFSPALDLSGRNVNLLRSLFCDITFLFSPVAFHSMKYPQKVGEKKPWKCVCNNEMHSSFCLNLISYGYFIFVIWNFYA